MTTTRCKVCSLGTVDSTWTVAPTRTRHTARLIVISPDDRILLFQWSDDEETRDPARPGAASYWNTPGGGIEPGESPEAAASRELLEETGISEAQVGPRLWTNERVVRFPGRAMTFSETYVLVRTQTADVSFDRLTPHERRWLRAHRWWTLDELRGTTEAIVPANLATLVEPLLAGTVPPAPYPIDL